LRMRTGLRCHGQNRGEPRPDQDTTTLGAALRAGACLRALACGPRGTICECCRDEPPLRAAATAPKAAPGSSVAAT
jgi:hypothetical protein